MSAALKVPAFLVPPDPAYLSAHPITSGEARILAQARARLNDWRSLDVGGRNKLLRNLGIALAAECGGLSLRQIASAADVSEAQVRKSLKLFRPDHAQSQEAPAPAG